MKFITIIAVCFMYINFCDGIHYGFSQDLISTEAELSQVVTYTYVDVKKRRNEALEICQKLGGTLINVYSAEIINIIEHFRVYDWNGAPNDDYWMGLSEPLEGKYFFFDCTEVFKDRGWSYFKTEDYKENELCYVGKKDGSNVWKSKKCSDKKDFICEKRTPGSCSMYTALESEYEMYRTNMTDCESKCHANARCWGYLHYENNRCKQLVTNTVSANSTDNATKIQLREKMCYTAAFVTDANNLPVVEDNNSLTPTQNCTSQSITSIQTSYTVATSSVTTSSLCAYTTVTAMETEVYNHTINITITATETETIPVTHTLTTTATDVQTESIYITAHVTAIETAIQFTSLPCVCPSVFTSTIISISTETHISSLQCPIQSCTAATQNNYITVNDTQALKESLEKIKKELTVLPSNTSAFKRKFISVTDDRQSAALIGYAGFTFLVIPLVVLLMIDIPRFIVGFKDLINKLKQ